MKEIMLFIAYLLFIFIPVKQSIHIYQQNRYQIERYRVWLFDEIQRKYRQGIFLFLMFLPIFALLFIWNHETAMAMLALLMFIYSYINLKVDDNRVYIKPLIYTNRVRRLLICNYVLFILVYGLLLTLPFYMVILCMPFFYLLPWAMLFIAAPCMMPIEKRIRLYYVKDAKRILRDHRDLIKIGITGSYGKTSVKTIAHELMSSKYYTFMTPNSYNNQMGITISIRRLLKPIHEVFLCEMGADHVHEIEELSKFVQPQIGILTAIGPQHLQTFKTQENITHEKMQLIENLPANGYAILNADDQRIRRYPLKNKVKIIWFGIHHESDYRAINIRYRSDGTYFQVLHDDNIYNFTTRLLGEHNVLNILAGIAAAHTMKVSMENLRSSVAQLPYVEHRLQLRKMNHFTLIDNAYNSNPKGASDSLEVLKQMPNRRFIITPGFIDLAQLTQAEHFKFGEHMADCCDEVILVGKQQTKDILRGLQSKNFMQDAIHVVDSTLAALALVNKLAKKDDTVLIENDLPDAFNH